MLSLPLADWLGDAEAPWGCWSGI